MAGLLSFLRGSAATPNLPDFSGLNSGLKYQSFRLFILNNGGTLQHLIAASMDGLFGPSYASAGGLADTINGASNVFGNLPIGPGATTAFVNGLCVPSDVLSHGLVFDTADLAVSDPTGITIVAGTNNGTALVAAPLIFSTNINGATRDRLTLLMGNAANNQPFAINTTNLAVGEFLNINLTGFWR